MPDFGKTWEWSPGNHWPLWANYWKFDSMEHARLDDNPRNHAGVAFEGRPEIPRQH